MEYNTLRSQLIIPEYGRHIQEMVNHCKTITDETERNGFAEIIIEVMGELNPHLRDVPDFQHKLWDQLFIMAEFDLDVKSPYPIPTKKDTVNSKPNKVEYPKSIYKYRYYGNNIRKMIDVAVTWEEGEKREGLYFAIANHMKKCYLLWNKDTVDDQVIFNHLYELSDGKIDLRKVDDHLVSPDRLNSNNNHSNNNQNNRSYQNNNRNHQNNNNRNNNQNSNNRQNNNNRNNQNNNNRNQNVRNNKG
ncbi:DUF4290 domain-containing protein [Empedobacter falsenii]|uniref:DUF4290 domain-containing protein n=1 Tax=Empedobacter falsenii TaxID=343874 RepID=A0A376GBE4_9FLAO|nr:MULTISPECIES: DUF4290 domain-containing protein [Empedobacter]HAR73155.1 DUF4290 domain-containing protein [Flavobacteriaceae bacterium]MDH1602251.1 DUF4290 domain-containing protein [Empedobacter sp. GD03739]MDM1061875.1 DUF4290 domain-containing protein [Empedobacter falsenii]MDM1138917.1 DUF4290 domain-containing protein [Empedobacter sp. R132-2]STD55776.1 Uncharacterised protein [Empedobacter falsenii]